MTDYAQKINALLAKAASTTHDAERETYTEAAERLMVKWGIDDAMLAATNAAAPRRAALIECRRYTIEGTSAALLAELVASQVAYGVGPVRTMFTPGAGRWSVVGHTDDLARIELYVPHIVTQAREAWKAHLAAIRRGIPYNDRERYSARIAFLTAFGATVSARLRELLGTEAAATSGAELVLANRDDAVGDYYAKHHGHVKEANARKLADYYAAQAGVAAGNEANLNAGALAGASA